MSSCRECYQIACCCPKSIRPTDALIDPTDAIRAHAHEIRMEILRRLLDRDEWARLVDLAIERSGPGSIGATEYGNRSYTKNDAELAHEGACEIADLIFYTHIPLTREADT